MNNNAENEDRCPLIARVIFCQCGNPSSHYGTMGLRGAMQVREEPPPTLSIAPVPKVGDIMVPTSRNRDGLRSGCEAYTCAICVSVEPFVMVSPEGDMMWTVQKVENFKVFRAATDMEKEQAFDRFFGRGQWAPPPASNELREYEASA